MNTVKYKEKILYLQQQAYLSEEINDYHYVAFAKDEDENEYLVKWPIINEDAEDEEWTCNWKDYEVKPLYIEKEQ